jgi:hypothetical protein
MRVAASVQTIHELSYRRFCAFLIEPFQPVAPLVPNFRRFSQKNAPNVQELLARFPAVGQRADFLKSVQFS